MAANVGTGTTISWSTSNPQLEILSITSGDASVPVIDVTHMGSTTSRAKITGDLRDEGDFTVEAHLDNIQMDLVYSSLGTSQTCTITLPLGSTDTSNATVSGTAAITSVNWSLPLEDKQLCNYTGTWLGVVTWADATT